MSKIITRKQLSSVKYKNKYLNVYPLHHNEKDKNGDYITVYELRGTSSKIKENFQTVKEILGEQ